MLRNFVLQRYGKAEGKNDNTQVMLEITTSSSPPIKNSNCKCKNLPAGSDSCDEELGAVGILTGIGHGEETWASVL